MSNAPEVGARRGRPSIRVWGAVGCARHAVFLVARAAAANARPKDHRSVPITGSANGDPLHAGPDVVRSRLRTASRRALGNVDRYGRRCRNRCGDEHQGAGCPPGRSAAGRGELQDLGAGAGSAGAEPDRSRGAPRTGASEQDIHSQSVPAAKGAACRTELAGSTNRRLVAHPNEAADLIVNPHGTSRPCRPRSGL